jgi:hypothetical protein
MFLAQKEICHDPECGTVLGGSIGFIARCADCNGRIGDFTSDLGAANLHWGDI